MATCTQCQSTQLNNNKVAVYEATGLMAPFTVLLENAVTEQTCGACGAPSSIYVPDMEGLLHAVVFARACVSRKLSGQEIRFMRRAMGWKAKDLAKELGVSAEFLSRCENGSKVLGETTEKLFRIFAILKTPDKELLSDFDLSGLFDLIKVSPTWDAEKPLTLSFVRAPRREGRAANGNGRWVKDQTAA